MLPDYFEPTLTDRARLQWEPNLPAGKLNLRSCRKQALELSWEETASVLYWALSEFSSNNSEPIFILYDNAPQSLRRNAFETMLLTMTTAESNIEGVVFAALMELWVSATAETRAKVLLAFHEDEYHREWRTERMDAWAREREGGTTSGEGGDVDEPVSDEATTDTTLTTDAEERELEPAAAA